MQRKVGSAMPKSPSRRKTEKPRGEPSLISIPNLNKQGVELTPMNFRVPETFHREFKLYAVQHGISMVDLLQQSFALFRKQRGI